MMKQVFIVGAYGQNNLGDEALLEVFMKQFEDMRIVVNSAQPKVTAKRYGVQAVGTYWNFPPRFSRLRVLLASDLIIFGGGSLLKEIEGGAVARLLYFARILLILGFARLTGKQTAMLGVGMGPLNYPLYKFLTRLSCALTDLICVRDTESRDILLEVGVQREVHVTADAVFTLDIQTPSLLLDFPLPQDAQFAVVVPRYSLTPVERKALAEACDHLIEQCHLRVLLIPFQSDYRQNFDDREAAQNIQSLMRHTADAHVWLSEKPSDVFEVIGRAQLVLSARLHALIFAAMQGVAPVAISYEVKVRSFMAELGESDSSLSLEDVQSGRLLPVLDRVLQQQDTIRERVKERSAVLRQKSQRNFEILREASKGNSSIWGGGLMLFVSMTLVNVGNYLFNLMMGRWLGPSAFADVSLMVTLILMLTFVTSTFNLVAARFTAAYEAQQAWEKLVGMRRWLSRWSVVLGAGTAVLLIGGAPVLSDVFHMASPLPFIILGVGVPIFFLQAVYRGVLQGQMRFGRLALSYQAEMWIRLLGALLLVSLGFAVNGAVAALTLSFAATWLVTRRVAKESAHHGALSPEERTAVLRYVPPVALALVSQILITNSDVLIVKHYFPSETAGQYAALALIGRIVFFATMSVVTTLFPLVAQKHQKGEPHRYLLFASMGLVGAVSAVIILLTLLVPELLINLLFGPAYLSITPLLWLYASATALYALANVIINYHLSIGEGFGGTLAVGASIIQIAALLLFHQTLAQMVIVEFAVMGLLLLLLLLWDVRRTWKSRQQRPAAPLFHSL